MDVLDRIGAFLNTGIAGSQFTPLKLLIVVTLLGVLVWVTRRTTHWLVNHVLARRGVDVGLREALGAITRYVVIGVGTLMRILITVNRQLQALQFRVRMPVVMLRVFQVVVMRVPGMPKTQARAEFVGFGNVGRRLQKTFLLDKRERLGAAIRTRSHHADIRSPPGMPAQRF